MSESTPKTLRTLDVAKLQQTYITKVDEKEKKQKRDLEDEATKHADTILDNIEVHANVGSRDVINWSCDGFASLTPIERLIPRVVELLKEANCPPEAINLLRANDGRIINLRIAPFWAQ